MKPYPGVAEEANGIAQDERHGQECDRVTRLGRQLQQARLVSSVSGARRGGGLSSHLQADPHAEYQPRASL
jgi:hypothetical protein